MSDFSTNQHHTVEDSPDGGGAGMVLRIGVVVPAVRPAFAQVPHHREA
jgi:tRNA (guanine-N1)-methyltransferase